MLAYFIAAALFIKKYQRPLKKNEQVAILEAMENAYRILRSGHSESPSLTLQHIRSNARVCEILDVSINSPSLSEPHSFILDFEEVCYIIKKHQAVVVKGVGCLVFLKQTIYLCTTTSQQKLKKSCLRQLFKKPREIITLSD
jgi:hypothetical protein